MGRIERTRADNLIVANRKITYPRRRERFRPTIHISRGAAHLLRQL